LSEIRVNQGSKVKTAAQRGSAVVDNARNLVCVFESRMSEVSSGGGEYDEKKHSFNLSLCEDDLRVGDIFGSHLSNAKDG
jgi:hypothetical protein